MKTRDQNSEQAPAPKVRKSDRKQGNQATGAEFEREGMGIAPKE